MPILTSWKENRNKLSLISDSFLKKPLAEKLGAFFYIAALTLAFLILICTWL
jgi:hypothetical protein